MATGNGLQPHEIKALAIEIAAVMPPADAAQIGASMPQRARDAMDDAHAKLDAANAALTAAEDNMANGDGARFLALARWTVQDAARGLRSALASA